MCSSCQTPGPVWTTVSGDGEVASWTVMRPPTLPAYASMVPFVVLLVTLDQGIRLLGYLVDDAGRYAQDRRRRRGCRDRTRVRAAIPRAGGHAPAVVDARALRRP